MKIFYKTLIILFIISLPIISQKLFALCTDKLSTKLIIQPEWTEEAKELLGDRTDINYYLETENEDYSINYGGIRYDFESEGFEKVELTFMKNLMKKVNKSLILNFNRSDREGADFLITKTCVPNEATYGVVQMSWDGTEYIMALNSCRPVFESRPEAAILHELGHVLGLEHPFDSDDGDCYQSTDPFSQDAATMSQTLMAYQGSENAPQFYTKLDLEAIAEVYGRKEEEKISYIAKEKKKNIRDKNNQKVWDSTYGNINITSHKDEFIKATYQSNGFIVLRQILQEFYSGYWVGNKEGSCDTEVLNERTKKKSNYWGRFELTFANDSFQGKWSYCNRRPEKEWNGILSKSKADKLENPVVNNSIKKSVIIQSWNSDYGKIDIVSKSEKNVKALYGSEGFIAIENVKNNIYSGYWIGKAGGSCNTKLINERTGRKTNYWGRLDLEFVENKFEGKWGYCMAEPLEPWNGKLIQKEQSISTEKSYNLSSIRSKQALEIAVKDGKDLTNLDLSKMNLSQAKLENARLNMANMNQVDLSWANLSNASLNNVRLIDANLSSTNLSDSLLISSNLEGSKLSWANFSNANLTSANLSNTDLTSGNFTKANLKNVDFSNANLGWVNFFKADLSGVDLSSANVDGVNFTSANLSGSNLKGINLGQGKLSKSNLSNANLSNANLSWANLSEAKLNGALLKGADLSNASLNSADLSEANLKESKLNHTDLSSANLSDANLNQVDLSSANLAGTDLSRAKLNHSNLSNTKIIAAELKQTNLEGANLSWAKLLDSDLSEANLKMAIISGADLTNVNLRKADLESADLNASTLRDTILIGANLSNTDLWGTDFTGADLTNANLKGANLKKTNFENVNLTNADLSNAKFSDNNFSGSNLEGVIVTDDDLRKKLSLNNINIEKPKEKQNFENKNSSVTSPEDESNLLEMKTQRINEPVGHKFNIIFDYRFDFENFFDTPAKRNFMNNTAKVYSNIIADDYPVISAGTSIKIRHPLSNEKVNISLDKDIDDIIVFVITKNKGPDGGKATGGYYGSKYNRYKGDFRPRLLDLTINTTASRPWFLDESIDSSWDIPNSTHYDLYSTVLHELGHGLGLLLGNMKSTGNFEIPNYFIGQNAQRANNNQPVVLENNSSHISRKTNAGLLRPNLDELMMHAISPMQGFRFWPTRIDVAMLEDLGYQVRYNQIPMRDDYPLFKDPRKKIYEEKYPNLYLDPLFPVGYWKLDDANHIYNTILGHPLKYMYNSTNSRKIQKWKSINGGVTVPQNGSFIVDHNRASNGGGSCLNNYSILMDILLPKYGSAYSLYNTSHQNRTDGDAWINKNGQIGQGNYSDLKVPENEWARIILTREVSSGRKFIINGSEVLKLSPGKVDGRFSIGTSQCYKPLFHLFGDDDGEDSDIHVQQVVFYDYALSVEQISRMGKIGNEISK